MATAIYTRKSVHRDESISHETQIEKCMKYLEEGETPKIYRDDGFSGGNTDRPAFKNLMLDIESGAVNKVIVYRYDRISRNLLDFTEMYQKFKEHNVSFVSATENFDTSSPMGEAAANMTMTFAQLERQTIRQRIIDAQNSRERKGYYMGGNVLFGYTLTDYEIGGTPTKKYIIVPDDAEIVRLIYQTYAEPAATFTDVLNVLKEHNADKRLKFGDRATISRLLRSTSYAPADIEVYRYFKRQGAGVEIVNSPEEFTGEHNSLYYYSDLDRCRVDHHSKGLLVVAPHEPIVTADLWLTCNEKLLSHKKNNRRTTAVQSILIGKMKCCKCGHGIVIRKCWKTNRRYCYCHDSLNGKLCSVQYPTLEAAEIESAVADVLRNRLAEIQITPTQETEDNVQKRIRELEALGEKYTADINKLIDNLIEATDITAKHINNRIKELDGKRTEAQTEADTLKYKASKTAEQTAALMSVMDKWECLTFSEQRSVIELTIDKIIIHTDKTLEIYWKF